jgi:hypothetical protein
VAQAGVESVPGLGGAAGMHILDDMGAPVQNQNHLALELEWQNCLHSVVPPQKPGCFGCYEGY